jgi:glycosyltransferase involved in cell wall biosynthesis
MPTRGRPEFAVEALTYWVAQTYPRLELVIVDDADAPSFPGPIMPEAGIQYHRLEHRLTVGAKRNLGCSRARGDIICHFDDDDISRPGRIADQVQRLLASEFKITGYNCMVFIDEAARRAWKYSGLKYYAIGTSLCYWRTFWQTHPFPERMNVGEDNWMVSRASGRIATVDAGDLMVARIHPGNTSPRDISGSEWKEVSYPFDGNPLRQLA